jgi:hypothetical protein
MAEKKLKFLLLKNYLTVVQASVGTNMFRKLYFHNGRRAVDVLQNGSLSCSFFVSAILKIFNLIGTPHATVHGTLRDLERHGWHKISKPKPGAIVVWAPQKQKNRPHRHLGIVIEGGIAINHRDHRRTPVRHRLDYRPIEYFLYHPSLEKK